MTAHEKSLRTPLAQARGLGSARAGSGHWWALRVTSVALVLLSILVVASFFTEVAFGDSQSTLDWLADPLNGIALILFLGVACHHAANGLQVVVEDYVHDETSKTISVFLIKSVAVTLALTGALAILFVFIVSVNTYMISNALPAQPTQ